MNVEKLKRLQAQVRIGGKGTPRRKKKVTHQTAAADDKKLQSSLKKLSVSTIPGIEEVNIIKNDLTVIHFNNPKAQASLSANTFAVTGHGETKKVVEMLPEILPQLGQETVAQLRMFANSMTNNQKSDESRQEKFTSTLLSNDDDVPMLVSDFDEIAKNEDLTTEKLGMESDKILLLEDNVPKSNVAQDMRLNVINSNDRKKVVTLKSDVNIEELSLITPKDVEYNNDQIHQKEYNYEPNVKSNKKEIQFQENYTKSSFKNNTRPIGEKKGRGAKKISDLKKAKEAHQANKNKSELIDLKEIMLHKNEDENILSKLKNTNSVDIRPEIDIQDQNNAKKTITHLEENTLICDDIAHTAENTNERKQSDIVNLEAKKDAYQNAEAKNTTLMNEIHNNEKLSPDVSICSEFNKTEYKDSMDSITSIKKELPMDIDSSNKEIESKRLEENNQTSKIKSIASNELIIKELNPNDTGKKKEKLNEKPTSSNTPLKMDELDVNPKDVVAKSLPPNQILEQSSIMADLQSGNVFEVNKSITTDLSLIIKKNIDSSNKTINDEIETLQKPSEEIVSNLTTFSQVTETDGEQTEEIANQNKIQSEILQELPEDATFSLTTVLSVTTASNEQTKEVVNENKIQTEVFMPNLKIPYLLTQNETKPEEIQEKITNYNLLKTQNLSAEAPSKTKIEQISQQTCGLESGATSLLTIGQTKEKYTNLDECSVTEDRKNEPKADEIQENENSHKIFKAQNLPTEIQVVTEIEEKLLQIQELENSGTSLTLGQDEDDRTTDTNNQNIVRALATVMSTEETSSEKNARTSPKAVKQPTPKRNETKKQSLPGSPTKTPTYSKKADIGVKSIQMSPPKSQTDISFLSKIQELPKPAPSTSVKPEKQAAPQKTKQQQTVSFKTQKTLGIRAGSITQSPIKLLTKGSTEISTKTGTTECLANVPSDQIVDQIPSTLEKPKKSLSSHETTETATKKNATETDINIPIKTEETSTTLEAIQNQLNAKAKQMKSTDVTTKAATNVDQTLSTAGKQKKPLSSTDMVKTRTKKNAIETTVKLPNKTRDQTLLATGVNQKQPKPKSLSGKPEPTSKTAEPKSKSSK